MVLNTVSFQNIPIIFIISIKRSNYMTSTRMMNILWTVPKFNLTQLGDQVVPENRVKVKVTIFAFYLKLSC